MQDLKTRIWEKLSGCSLRKLEETSSGDAAVLIPVLSRDRPCLLLTRRTQDVATHKGQISFPGGLRENLDASLRETALRETEEEVGIPRIYVEVLGRFHDYLSVTNYRVAAFVGFLKEGFPASLNPREVDCILEVPFDFFRETVPKRQVLRHDGEERTVYSYDYQGEVIWGLTAGIIRDFLEMLEPPD